MVNITKNANKISCELSSFQSSPDYKQTVYEHQPKTHTHQHTQRCDTMTFHTQLTKHLDNSYDD